MDSEKKIDEQRADAVCFTAGPSGVYFGAGVIHAYLAADRDTPELVAGVSAGALSAAAFQRAFRELNRGGKSSGKKKSVPESVRWGWYRRYLAFLVERPLDVFWKVVPDVSDLLADSPPIRETSLPDPEREWKPHAERARQEYHLTVKLLKWLTFVRTRVSDFAWLAVAWVRSKERYPDRFVPAWLWSAVFVLRCVVIAMSLSWTVTVHPGIYWAWPYRRVNLERADPATPKPAGLIGRLRQMVGSAS